MEGENQQKSRRNRCCMRAAAAAAQCRVTMINRSLLLLLLSTTCVFYSLMIGVLAQDTSFSMIHDFTQENMCLLGSSFIRQGDLELTLDSTVLPVTFSVGRALYNNMVRLRDPASNTVASFQTVFGFSIQSLTGVAAGDGLAFIIVPDDSSIGSYGGWLGVLNTTTLGNPSSRTFAVEFDTYDNPKFQDLNSNHVGIDIDTMVSSVSVDAWAGAGINLSEGANLTAWIDYDAGMKLLEVRLVQNSLQKPSSPLLNATVDFSQLFDEYMYVGFSAATGSLVEVHTVYSWNFTATGLPPVGSPSPLPAAAATPPVVASFPPSPVQAAATANPVAGAGSSAAVGTASAKCRGREKLQCQVEVLVTGFCIGVGGLLTLSLAVGLCVVVQRKLLRRMELCSALAPSYYDHDSGSGLISGPRKFTYKELSVATKDFSSQRLLGMGGSGSVYKGVMPDDGAMVAVKCISGDSKGKKEFLVELSIISKLRHRNLVPLQGWCHGKGQLLLVYDYMPNGSLDKLLFANLEECVLCWERRSKIVIGIAAALTYLHEECEQRVLHRDVKASNVMLDASFNARLGDFGLARLSEHNKSPETTEIVGTFGYMAPESTRVGTLTEKSDVFSFGAVTLEIVCGRRPIQRGAATPPDEIVLVDWVWGLHQKQKLLQAVDPRLGAQHNAEEVTKFLLVGLLCSHPDPDARPTMRHVMQILSEDAPLPVVPSSKPVPTYLATDPSIRLHDIITVEHDGLCSSSTISSC
ncbi:hypothetical protein CY35_15G067000 [Sphagnum magellanicum]|nr:hypothetical protein CY35_15G067000 [Sphagnum magellanicum]